MSDRVLAVAHWTIEIKNPCTSLTMEYISSQTQSDTAYYDIASFDPAHLVSSPLTDVSVIFTIPSYWYPTFVHNLIANPSLCGLIEL